MNKKLRLLVTAKCPNKCELCCNKQFDLNSLPIVNRWDYDEIMITGGEPLLFPIKLSKLLSSIRELTYIQGNHPKIYIYSAKFNKHDIIALFKYIDGIVLTPHKKEDMTELIELNQQLLDGSEFDKSKSLRLKLFPDMKALLPKDIDLSLWQVRDVEWIENCPLPEGEDFCRIANLW